MMGSVVALLLTFSLFSRLSISTCFLPNGSVHNDPGTQTCSFDQNDLLYTTCCHSKWENKPGGDVKYGPTADECLPNGVCQNQGFSTVEGDEHPAWTHYYRVYCTNEDWSGCLNVCDTGLNANDVVQLTPCDGTANSEQWCCGDTTNCCTPEGSHRAVTIARKLGSTPTSEPGNTSGRRDLSTGEIFGLVFGVLIGVLSLTGNMVLLLKFWPLKRRSTASSQDKSIAAYNTGFEEPPLELETINPRVELVGSHNQDR